MTKVNGLTPAGTGGNGEFSLVVEHNLRQLLFKTEIRKKTDVLSCCTVNIYVIR